MLDLSKEKSQRAGAVQQIQTASQEDMVSDGGLFRLIVVGRRTLEAGQNQANIET